MAAVSGLDPSILADPTYQVQMARAQRQMALAQALRQQSLQDTPGNGGSVSWTQGLARLADALSSSIGERRAEKNMIGANQGYARGMWKLFHPGQPYPGDAPAAPQGAPPMPQGAPPMAQGGPPMAQGVPPQMSPPQQMQPPQPGPPPGPGLGNDPNPVSNGADPLAPLPNAPPQAAPQQPPASSPASVGGAPQRGPWSLTGNGDQDMAAYMMNQDEYGKALIGNLAKSAAPTDTEVLMAHAKQLAAQGDYQGAAMLQQQALKAGVMPLDSIRPGGVGLDPITHKPVFQAPKVGEGQFVTYGADGLPQQVANIPGALESSAAQARATAGAQAAGKAPYQFQGTFENGQPGVRSVANLVGQNGSLNQHYGAAGGQGQSGAPANGFIPTGPQMGAQAAANTYGQGSAQGALETQNSAEGSQIRVQAYREMQNLLHGGLSTGPTQARMQELAEEHGISFLAKDNAFVFNKDAALAVAQQAKALGLNSSDARFEAVARATPNMKMTPQALAQVIPVRIGMEYASQAEATANANWIAQHGPQTNPQFKNFWRQNYDPRMFTAYAQGGPQALAKAPANLRQQWLSEYRNLKSMGFSFQQLAQ